MTMTATADRMMPRHGATPHSSTLVSRILRAVDCYVISEAYTTITPIRTSSEIAEQRHGLVPVGMGVDSNTDLCQR